MTESEVRIHQQKAENKHERSFPLISLLQLITFFIALLVCIDGKKLLVYFSDNQYNLVSFYFSIFAVALIGFLVGFTIGLGHIRRGHSILVCGASGALIGVLFMAIFVAPASIYQSIAAPILPFFTTIVARFRTP